VKEFALKHTWSQTSQSEVDTALQLRILATCRLHDALTEHFIKARKFFVNLTATEQRKLAEELASRLDRIEPVDSRGRLLVHLGQIHGDLSHQVADHISAGSDQMGPSVQTTGCPAQGQPIKHTNNTKLYHGVEG
jgi:catalase